MARTISTRPPISIGTRLAPESGLAAFEASSRMTSPTAVADGIVLSAAEAAGATPDCSFAVFSKRGEQHIVLKMHVRGKVALEFGEPCVERLPRAACAIGRHEVAGHGFDLPQLLVVLIVIVAHLGDRRIECAVRMPPHCREKDKLFLLHVDFDLAQQLLQDVAKTVRRLRMRGVNRFDLACEFHQFGQFATVGLVVAADNVIDEVMR